ERQLGCASRRARALARSLWPSLETHAELTLGMLLRTRTTILVRPCIRLAHEGRELAVETRRVLVERRMADALVDRELCARNRLRGVLRGADLGVAIFLAVRDQ